MQSGELILSVVEIAEEVPGKTALQKLCYFSNEVLDAEIPFKPHYYGPYSASVSNKTEDYAAVDFLDEEVERGTLASPWRTDSGEVITEWQRHNYELTEEGQTYVATVRDRHRVDYDRIAGLIDRLRDLTDLDSTQLSNMAKVHYIRKHDGPQNPTQIKAVAADEYNWNLSPAEIERALEQLGQLEG